MHRTLTTLAMLLVGCWPPLPSLGDEAGETTETGEESTDEASTTTEESTDEASPEDDTSDDGATFVPFTDLRPGLNLCDPFDHDCPRGEKCMPYAESGDTWDAYKCVPILGDQQPGEPCTWNGVYVATDDCDATSMCWDGECAPFCMGTADAPECPAGSFCLLTSEFSPTVCVSHCDPVLQDCGEGLGCYWDDTAFNCIFTTDDIPTGEPCGFINDCAAGNVCADAATLPECASSECCADLCNLLLGDEQCSEPGTACIPFYDEGETPPGDEHVGICILPPRDK
jgi:hypothetical protein